MGGRLTRDVHGSFASGERRFACKWQPVGCLFEDSSKLASGQLLEGDCARFLEAKVVRNGVIMAAAGEGVSWLGARGENAVARLAGNHRGLVRGEWTVQVGMGWTAR